MVSKRFDRQYDDSQKAINSPAAVWWVTGTTSSTIVPIKATAIENCERGVSCFDVRLSAAEPTHERDHNEDGLIK